MFNNQVNLLDSDSEDEDEDFIIAPEELGHTQCNHCSHTWHYLTHSELLLHPQGRTPWQVLYHHQNDRAFITTMGFDVQCFQLILESGFQEVWDTHPISQPDMSAHGHPWPSSHSLDACGALGFSLHYLSSAIPETGLQQIFALVPTTVSRYINFISISLSTPSAQFQMPPFSGQRDKTFKSWMS